MTIAKAEHLIETMSEERFERFLSILPPEITEADKQTMRTHRAFIKLFTNLSYHQAVKEALATQILRDLKENTR